MKEKEYLKCINQETWFHGTTLSGWKSICEHKVQVDYNIGTSLDFGYGFYLTPKFSQAKSYITRMLPYTEKKEKDDEVPVVIEFEINFSNLIHTYKNIKFLHYDREFAMFVFRNRNYPDKRMHDYDFIIGVMSDSNPDELIAEYQAGNILSDDVIHGLLKWTSMVQASLHNQELCDKLKMKKATRVDTGKELDADDFKRS